MSGFDSIDAALDAASSGPTGMLVEMQLLAEEDLEVKTRLDLRAGRPVRILALTHRASAQEMSMLKRHGAGLLARPVEDVERMASMLRVQEEPPAPWEASPPPATAKPSSTAPRAAPSNAVSLPPIVERVRAPTIAPTASPVAAAPVPAMAPLATPAPAPVPPPVATSAPPPPVEPPPSPPEAVASPFAPSPLAPPVSPFADPAPAPPVAAPPPFPPPGPVAPPASPSVSSFKPPPPQFTPPDLSKSIPVKPSAARTTENTIDFFAPGVAPPPAAPPAPPVAAPAAAPPPIPPPVAPPAPIAAPVAAPPPLPPPVPPVSSVEAGRATPTPTPRDAAPAANVPPPPAPWEAPSVETGGFRDAFAAAAPSNGAPAPWETAARAPSTPNAAPATAAPSEAIPPEAIFDTAPGSVPLDAIPDRTIVSVPPSGAPTAPWDVTGETASAATAVAEPPPPALAPPPPPSVAPPPPPSDDAENDERRGRAVETDAARAVPAAPPPPLPPEAAAKAAVWFDDTEEDLERPGVHTSAFVDAEQDPTNRTTVDGRPKSPEAPVTPEEGGIAGSTMVAPPAPPAAAAAKKPTPKVEVEAEPGSTGTFAIPPRAADGLAPRAEPAVEKTQELPAPGKKKIDTSPNLPALESISATVSDAWFQDSDAGEAKGSGPSVLVVDDEPAFRSFLKDALTEQGYRVHTAINGPNALRFIKNTPAIDLVIADLHMPHMDGFELKHEIDQIIGRPMPFIVCTGDASEDKIQTAAQVGAAALVPKPIENLDAFFAIVTDTLKDAGVVVSKPA